MSWVYRVSRPAEHDIGRLDRPMRVRIFDALDELVRRLNEEGWPLPEGYIGDLEGRPGEYKRRVGQYRIVFERAQAEMSEGRLEIVMVLKVAHRSRVYKGR